MVTEGENESKVPLEDIYAIDQYIASLTTAINEQDPDRLILPEIVMVEEHFEDDLDGE